MSTPLFTGDAVASAIAGLAGGLFAGLFTAGTIAWRTAAIGDRYRATTTIRGILTTYRSQLVYDQQLDFAISSKPTSFADIKGRQKMAGDVMAQTSALTARKAQKIRAGLVALIGVTPMAFVERRVFLPEGFVDDDREHSLEAQELIKERGGGQDTSALFGTVYPNHDGHDRQIKFQILLAKFDELIALVS